MNEKKTVTRETRIEARRSGQQEEESNKRPRNLEAI